MITLLLISYFLLPVLAKGGMARCWLRPFEERQLSNLLWWSWGWTCFIAPALGVPLAMYNYALLTCLPLEWPASPVWSSAVAWLLGSLPTCLLWLGFDWWLAKRLLAPSTSRQRAQVAAWAWSANALWILGLCGLVQVSLTPNAYF